MIKLIQSLREVTVPLPPCEIKRLQVVDESIKCCNDIVISSAIDKLTMSDSEIFHVS